MNKLKGTKNVSFNIKIILLLSIAAQLTETNSIARCSTECEYLQ